jgi:hypothetical protein
VNYLKRVLGFVAKNVAVIVALSSLFVACLSLYFTIQAQKADMTYKELAIRPAVGIGADVSNFTIYLTNSGYGHAIVHRVAFGVEGKCYSSDMPDETAYEDAYSRFEFYILNEVYQKSYPATDIKSLRDVFVTTGGHLDNGSVIRADEKFQMFYLEPAALALLTKLDLKTLTGIRNNFSRAVSTMPLRIEYCSATGQYCEIIDTKNQQCK